MSWLEKLLDILADAPAWSYGPPLGAFGGGGVAAQERKGRSSPPASEPTALAALALLRHGRWKAAVRACQWLADRQTAAGSVGVMEGHDEPAWTTGWAVLAWRASRRLPAEFEPERFETRVESAMRWLLEAKGEVLEPSAEMGHDVTLPGWPWVLGTHSWIEPTAISLLALRAAGESQHERAQLAEKLLLDRLLPSGGCNYGNTVVLGQTLRPHVAPTGLAMLALSGVSDPQGRIAASLDYLQNALDGATAPTSLALGLLGLAAHGQRVSSAEDWLAGAASRLPPGRHASAALLALAASIDGRPSWSDLMEEKR